MELRFKFGTADIKQNILHTRGYTYSKKLVKGYAKTLSTAWETMCGQHYTIDSEAKSRTEKYLRCGKQSV